jgi:hypothetical protein
VRRAQTVPEVRGDFVKRIGFFFKCIRLGWSLWGPPGTRRRGSLRRAQNNFAAHFAPEPFRGTSESGSEAGFIDVYLRWEKIFFLVPVILMKGSPDHKNNSTSLPRIDHIRNSVQPIEKRPTERYKR